MSALPALTKTYSARGNQLNASNTTALLVAQSTVFALKEHMKNAASGGTTSGSRHANSVWATKGSSDGTTANLAGSDLIAAHTNLVWSAGNHSWWWGENATCGYQVVIDCCVAASTSLAVVFAPIGTPFTGGDITTRPESTREFICGTTSTGAGTAVTFLTDVVTGNNNYTHYVTADDGQFWFLVSRSGGGIFTTCLGFQKSVGSTDPRAAFGIFSALNSSRGAMNYLSVFNSNTGAVSRQPNGLAVGTGGLTRGGSAAGSEYLGVGGTDANTGKYLAFPTDAFSLSASQYAWRGRIPDMCNVGLRPVGDSYPSTAAQERVVVGDCLLPFPGVVPIT